MFVKTCTLAVFFFIFCSCSFSVLGRPSVKAENGTRVFCLDTKEDLDRGEWRDYSYGRRLAYSNDSNSPKLPEEVQGKFEADGIFFWTGSVLTAEMNLHFVDDLLAPSSGNESQRIFLYLRYYEHNTNFLLDEIIWTRPALQPDIYEDKYIDHTLGFVWHQQVIELNPDSSDGISLNAWFFTYEHVFMFDKLILTQGLDINNADDINGLCG